MTAGGTKLSAFVATQVASRLTSGAAAFALSLYLYQSTGRADVMAGAVAVRFGTSTLSGFVAGALVDRYPRGRLIVSADLGFAACTAALWLVTARADAAIWLVYLLLAVEGLLDAVHALATQSLPTLLGDKASLLRFNARVGLIDALPSVLAPVVGAAVSAKAPLGALFALDALTFVLAAVITSLLRIPRAPAGAARGTLLADARLGFRRIAGDPVLRALACFFSAMNLAAGLCGGLLSPYILGATGGDRAALAAVSASAAVGALAGAIASERLAQARAATTLLALLAVSAAGRVLFGLSDFYLAWIAAIFVRNAALVAGNGCSQALWQARTAPDELGRVLGARRVIAQGVFPVAVAVGGLAAASAEAGGGRGIGRLFMLCGTLELLVVFIGSLLPPLRAAEAAPDGRLC